MATNQIIDPVNGVEQVLSPSFDINFGKNIIIKSKKKATEKEIKYDAGYIV